MEHVLLVLIYLYSLTGQECYNSPMEEEQIKVCGYVHLKSKNPSIFVNLLLQCNKCSNSHVLCSGNPMLPQLTSYVTYYIIQGYESSVHEQ